MKRPKWKTLSPEEARAAGYVALSATLLVIVTCAGAARPFSAPPAVASTAPPVSASVAAVAPEAVPAATAPAELPASAAIERFRAALRALREKRRTESVRVLWLGDSHTAADFWTDAVRRPLQATFGNGGPGFLYVGLNVYRHASVKVSREGRWRTEPKQPSLWMRQDDGVFGLGGMRTVPESGDAKATFELAKDAVSGRARWDIAFRLPDPHARFDVVSEGQRRTIGAGTAPIGSVAHVEWESAPGAVVTVGQASGNPEIFGIVVESSDPGVVVDTLGINGARIGTPLAWEAGPWIDEARRRKPDLVVLAYGTNECGDGEAPFRYAPEIASLVERARTAAPDADCVVIGPTDRADPEWATMPRVAEIDAVEKSSAERSGCAFFSAWQAMGGEGSLKRWADQEPPLAATDHVHLTPRGYGELGRATLDTLGGAGP